QLQDRMFNSIASNNWILEGQEATPLDYLPDEVNAFVDTDVEKIRLWWDQAMGLVVAKEGLHDLFADCEDYSLESIQRLLRFCEPIRYYYRDPSSGLSGEFSKRLDCNVMLGGAYDYYEGDNNFPIEIFFLTSVLIREWFRKKENIASSEGVTEVLTFLREFRMQHGFYFPYDQARIFDLCVTIFSKAETDAEKTTLVRLFDDYGDELMRGTPQTSPVASVLMKPIFAWVETQPSLSLQSEFFEKKSPTKVSTPESDLGKLVQEKTTSKEQCRDALEKIKGTFDHVNWSKRIAEVARSLWNEYRKAEGSQVSGGGVILDRVREEDPSVAALLLTAEEFEEVYFGEGRDRYTPSAYAALDDHVPLYRSVVQLWERAEYREEIAARVSPNDRLALLLETFPVACAKRDQLCVTYIGWGELKNVEDVLTLQERFIATNEDVPLLFTLSQGFTNAFLRVACAQQLWQLYEKDPNRFFSAVPSNDQKRVRDALHGMHPAIAGERLRAIILCYPDPSYLRDDLLRPLIDAAPSEATTLNLASFLAEPPPGVIRRRTSTMVTTSESILDAAREMKPIDKKEIILYLLGHRTFYSAIDAQFQGTRTGHEDAYREVLLLEGAKAFERESGERIKTSLYIVKKPDALALLGKYSGAPLDLLVQQERLTTTRREEADLLYFVLLGPHGVLRESGKERFLRRAAGTIVRKGEFAKELSKEEKKSIVDLLAFALAHCPEEKIPNLFLNLWYISREAKKSLPDLTASLFREYGPVFIKAGQYLATQTATLPPEWTTAFRALSDKNRAIDKTLLYEYEYREYGEDSPFALVGKKVGEGSMAAVYEGKLLNGKRIAAKVVHPFIEREIQQDTEFLDAIVHFVNEHSKNYGGVRLPQNLAEVTRRHMVEEIDTKRETAQAKELASVLSPQIDDVYFSAPPVHDKESRGRFLVTDYGEGVAMDNDTALQAQGIDAKQVRQSVALEVLRQIIAVGVYQADTNLGNFSVAKRSDGKALVHWFDAGHVGRLAKEDRVLLKDLIRGMLFGADAKVIADIFTAMTEVPEGISGNDVSTWVSEWCSKQLVGFRDMGDMQRLFTELLDFYAEKKLVLKEQWVVLLRTIGLLQPMLRDTDPARLQQFLAPHIFSET
ncbi:MAG: AarF/UbiB family protein, partial [bacterium]|nr:AarF/UbiB family protein [bacterium]